MQATLPTVPTTNARNLSCDKETIQTYNAVSYNRTLDQIQTHVTAHVYASRTADGASPKYASIWVHGHQSSGYGKVSGYGYHKASAALQAAISSAGITLTQPIDGHGDNAIESAIRAIAMAAGADPTTLTVI